MKPASYATTYEKDNSAETTSQEMIIPSINYTQSVKSIKAVEKNNGNLLSEETNNSIFVSKYVSFVVFKYVSNGSTGLLVATGNSKYVGGLSATCPLNISNEILCTNDECTDGMYNLIFRPISLTNPFPNINGNENSK